MNSGVYHSSSLGKHYEKTISIADADAFFQPDTGTAGIGGLPDGMENHSLGDAWGSTADALPDATSFDSDFYFGLTFKAPVTTGNLLPLQKKKAQS